MGKSKLKQEIIKGAVVVEHQKGEMATINRLAGIKCPSCGETFYQVAKRASMGRKVKCGFCGIELENIHKKRWEVKIA